MRQNCDNCGTVCRPGDLGLCVKCEKFDTGVLGPYDDGILYPQGDGPDDDWYEPHGGPTWTSG